jgi:ATP-dependent Clp endopeptidase proteolytic subunit ClpP
VLLYGVIGWENPAKDFVDSMKKLKGKHVNVRLNSPGGDVFDAVAMVNAISSHVGGVTAYVDGLAASAASWIALAANKVVMAHMGRMMIHDAASRVCGNAAEMRRVADQLDSISDTIASAYAKKTGKSHEEVRSAMKEETYFTAEEAKDWGLVDEIAEGVRVAACVTPEIANALGYRKELPANHFPLRNQAAIALRELELDLLASGS